MNDIFMHSMNEEAAEHHLLKMENIHLHRSGAKITRAELTEILRETLKERAKQIIIDYINADLNSGPNAYQVFLRAQKTSETTAIPATSAIPVKKGPFGRPLKPKVEEPNLPVVEAPKE